MRVRSLLPHLIALAASAAPLAAQDFTRRLAPHDSADEQGRRWHHFTVQGGPGVRANGMLSGTNFSPALRVVRPDGTLLEEFPGPVLGERTWLQPNAVSVTQVGFDAGQPGTWHLYVTTRAPGRAGEYGLSMDVKGPDGAVPVIRAGDRTPLAVHRRRLANRQVLTGLHLTLGVVLARQDAWFRQTGTYTARVADLRIPEGREPETIRIVLEPGGAGVRLEITTPRLPGRSCVAYLGTVREKPRTRAGGKTPARFDQPVCDDP